MKREPPGQFLPIIYHGDTFRAFVPAPLPPKPAIGWTPERRARYDRALLALGRLQGIPDFAPEISTFLPMYVRKEALLSSMIEGSRTSLTALLLFELNAGTGAAPNDVREVSNYTAALEHGLKRLAGGSPLSLRLIRELHGVLLSGGRFGAVRPGEFRKTQNWVGGTRPGNAVFIPPPADKVWECMGRLELFLHDWPETAPALLKTALAHAQFEIIHPFIDGNGRLGRLLIPLLLHEYDVLKEPMLYLSLYLKYHRQKYFKLLNEITATGNWESWLDFFAEAVFTAASHATDTARTLLNLVKEDGEKIYTLGRAAPSALRIQRTLLERPVTNSGRLVTETGITAATVNKCLEHLQRLAIVRELTARKRNRIFSYAGYLDIMNQGTDLSD